MNREEWALYEDSLHFEPAISGDDFDEMDWTDHDRLLLRGYHANGGANIRVWLDWRRLIGRQLDAEEVVWRAAWDIVDLYPTKRAYREDTDLGFAILVRERYSYPLTFTTWRN